MKHLILIAALVAAPAFAQPNQELYTAKMCGVIANMATIAANASRAGVPYSELQALTKKDKQTHADDVREVVTRDAFYAYSSMPDDAIRSLSYIKCQTLLPQK
jgi:hypothetical protein